MDGNKIKDESKPHFGVQEEPWQAKEAAWIKRFVKIINYRIINPSYLASTSGRCRRADLELLMIAIFER